jgi:predicted permease
MPWEATAILLSGVILTGVLLFFPLRWLALRRLRPEASPKVGAKALFAAGAVVAIFVSLAWLKQAGSTYASIAFSLLTVAVYIGGYILLVRQRRRAKEQKRTVDEPIESK